LVGYKLGFTSKAKMEQMGVHEIIWGHLTNAMDQSQNGELDLNSYIHPRAEPEIAFSIGRKITKPLTAREVQQYVSGVAVAVEIIDSRYRNFSFSLEDVVADNCSSAAFAIGTWMDPTTSINNINMQLLFNDREVHQGNSNAIMGNPYESLAALTKLTAARGLSIPQGFLVLAGAATPAAFIDDAQNVIAHAEGLGKVRLTVKSI